MQRRQRRRREGVRGRVPKTLPGQSEMSGNTGYSVRSGFCDMSDLSDKAEYPGKSVVSGNSGQSVDLDAFDAFVSSV